jgi:predicted enzyme related to lactoylglutathione lyase
MTTGRFVWHELMTTDTKAAIAFYTEVIGWKTQPFTEGVGDYTMWVGSQGPLGGVMALSDEAKKMGAVPGWMGHVEVSDVDATVALVKKKGGNVHVPPQDIPKVGRFSVVADPQGAVISVFKPLQAMQVHDSTKAGEVSWNELYANDGPAALAFYSEIFGWQKLGEMDMGPSGTYLLYGQGDTQYGGVMTKTPEMPMPPCWIYYINVDGLEAAMKRATSKGATAIFGPQEVPGGTFVAQLKDPQGAVFALHAKTK